MNCLEFRRMLLTEPGSQDPAFVEHKHRCADCADAVGRSAQFEQRLQEAVRIEAPENLASRILLKQSFASPVSKRWWRNAGAVALAASLLLVVGLVASSIIGTHARHQRLSEEFVALVNGAPNALSAPGPVSSDDVSAALRPVGLDLEGDIGRVTFASRCLVRGKLAGHLVLQGESGRVTVFLVPFTLVDERADIRTSHYSGVVVPLEGRTVAIVSPPGEALEGIEERVVSAVRWET